MQLIALYNNLPCYRVVLPTWRGMEQMGDPAYLPINSVGHRTNRLVSPGNTAKQPSVIQLLHIGGMFSHEFTFARVSAAIGNPAAHTLAVGVVGVFRYDVGHGMGIQHSGICVSQLQHRADESRIYVRLRLLLLPAVACCTIPPHQPARSFLVG